MAKFCGSTGQTNPPKASSDGAWDTCNDYHQRLPLGIGTGPSDGSPQHALEHETPPLCCIDTKDIDSNSDDLLGCKVPDEYDNLGLHTIRSRD
jgi:hypothetical protein